MTNLDKSKTLDGYQFAALRTWEISGVKGDPVAVLALGLAGESGEVADVVKKHLGHGHPLDNDKMLAEMGDVLWYLAVLSNHLGFTLAEVAEANVTKLKRRYPDGFSSAASMNRGVTK